MSITVIFLVVAIILFILAAVNVASPKFNLIAAGLAFFAASFLPLGG
jgi:uncharacterized integral membrane protein